MAGRVAALWHRKGSAMILFTLLLPTFILPMVGLGIDGAILFMVKAKLSAAVDAGALAAARSLNAGLTLADQEAAAKQTGRDFVKANFPDRYWGSSNLRFEPDISVTPYDDPTNRRRIVSISAYVDAPLYFMRIFGKNSATVAGSAVAARRDVRLVLVLDRSSSMSGAIETLKGKAIEFVSNFASERDQVGLVVFGGSAIVAFPPRNPANPSGGTGPSADFKTASPSVPELIGQIKSGSNTGTAEALWLAYQELKKSELPGALNVIVLFTDGLPNGITAYYNDPDTNNNAIKTSSGCKYKSAKDGIPDTQMIGFISQWSNFAVTGTTAGIQRLSNRTAYSNSSGAADVKDWMSHPDEGVIQTIARDNCAFKNDVTQVKNDLKKIPSSDVYGNRTDTEDYRYSTLYANTHDGSGRQIAFNKNGVDSPYQIGLASWNATADAVRRIRNDSSISPTIYTIGYSGNSEIPDVTLMKMIANVDDPGNSLVHSLYRPDKPSGFYVMAPTPDELKDAFDKVAAEILRLVE